MSTTPATSKRAAKRAYQRAAKRADAAWDRMTTLSKVEYIAREETMGIEFALEQMEPASMHYGGLVAKLKAATRRSNRLDSETHKATEAHNWAAICALHCRPVARIWP